MLAEILGMPVVTMKASMSQDEYAHWMIYLRYKQPGIQEVQMAVLSSMVSSGLGGKGKVADFILSEVSNSKPKSNKDAAFHSFDAIATEYKGSK